MRSFRSYAHRHKLASYIGSSSQDGHTAVLWSLHRHKARVVQAAVANALSRRVTSRHSVLLRRVENSTSPTTRRLLLPLAIAIARPRDADKLRGILRGNTRESVSCALIGLAQVGSRADRPLLEHWTRRGVGGRGTREIAWASLGLHAGKQCDGAYVRRAIRHARARALRAFLRGLSYSQSKGLVPLILSGRRRLDRESIDAISRCAASQDAPILARLLQRRGVSEETKPILLALLSFGRPTDVSLVLRLIVRSKRRVDFREQYDVVFAMAKAAKHSGIRSQLLSLIRAKEFWEYFPVRPNQGALPVGDREHIPLLRRIVGMCFSEVASARDRGLLRKMLAHSYWPVYYGAARALSRMSGLHELDRQIDRAIQRSEGAKPIRGFLEAIHLMDRRVYGGLQAEVAPETDFGKVEY